ncbi:hypothetical protein BDV59DRAFT_147877 [Aspergillus ambiguus]|uniref:uncharacterized protein n=1 Tax=Aspergillus ambiguus TaxID=176160 RepID=UPI003CCE1B30
MRMNSSRFACMASSPAGRRLHRVTYDATREYNKAKKAFRKSSPDHHPHTTSCSSSWLNADAPPPIRFLSTPLNNPLQARDNTSPSSAWFLFPFPRGPSPDVVRSSSLILALLPPTALASYMPAVRCARLPLEAMGVVLCSLLMGDTAGLADCLLRRD